MTKSQFDTNPEIQAVLEEFLQAISPSDAMKALTTAQQFDKEALAYIANKIDQAVNNDVDLESLKDQAEEEKKLAENLEQARLSREPHVLKYWEDTVSNYGLDEMFEMVAFIAENAGDQASPFVKAFAKEAAKLTDAEYALPENQLKAMVRAKEELLNSTPAASPKPKKNPFSKGPGGI